MVLGLTTIVLCVAAAGIAVFLFGLVCYSGGFRAGMESEVEYWCTAFNKVQPPNWQSFPVDHSKGEEEVEKQVAAAKLYVQVFKVTKLALFEELVRGRVDLAIQEVKDALKAQHE